MQIIHGITNRWQYLLALYNSQLCGALGIYTSVCFAAFNVHNGNLEVTQMQTAQDSWGRRQGDTLNLNYVQALEFSCSRKHQTHDRKHLLAGMKISLCGTKNTPPWSHTVNANDPRNVEISALPSFYSGLHLIEAGCLVVVLSPYNQGQGLSYEFKCRSVSHSR